MTDNWANRKDGLVCGRCIWWAHKANRVGRCRRRAPVVGDGWPVTFDTDWCGDFKLSEHAPRTEKAQE